MVAVHPMFAVIMERSKKEGRIVAAYTHIGTSIIIMITMEKLVANIGWSALAPGLRVHREYLNCFQ